MPNLDLSSAKRLDTSGGELPLKSVPRPGASSRGSMAKAAAATQE